MKFNVKFPQQRNYEKYNTQYGKGHFFSQINLLPAFPTRTLFKYACIFISFNILIMTIN